MRTDEAYRCKPVHLWRGIRWVAALAAVAVVAFASLANASDRRGRGLLSAKPSFAQHAVFAQRTVRNPAARMQSVRPPRINRPPRGPRHPPRGPRGPRGPNVPGLVIPGIIGIIGTLATEPAPAEPEYYPPPRRPAANDRPPRRRPAANDRPPRRRPAANDRRPRRRPVANDPPPLPPRRPIRTAQGAGGAPPPGEQRLVPDEVVIQVPAGASQQAIEQLAARHQLTRLESQTLQLTGESMVRWRIPDQRSVTAVIAALEADAGVISAQPNYLFTLQQGTTGIAKGDPAQYAVGKLHLPEAHALATGDKVLIGVIDSGIDIAHPELAGMIAASFDTMPGEAPHSHGTAIAGTIVAHARLLGVAPASRILAVRAFGGTAATAQATTFNILKGIDWAARNGARVINMSFAGPRDPAISRQLAAAHKRNIVLIAAAGNAGPTSPPLYPAANPNVIAVAATDRRDRLFDQSNRGRHISIAAPGVDIIAPAPRNAYQITSGTSISAAYISGLAALLIERNPNLKPAQVRSILQATAHDLGKQGRDPKYGAGLANAYRALQSVQAPAADAVTSSRR